MERFEPDAYRFIAPVYDLIADVYSAGRIRRSRLVLLEGLGEGSRVLFAGCGSGAEVVAAAARGARVTAADKSPRMLRRLKRRASAAGVQLEIFQGDIRRLEIAPHERFELVAAHYFLNVFAPGDMRAMLGRLADLTRPGGRLFIADFAPPESGRLRGLLQRVYYSFALRVFRLLVSNADHPIYDYGPELEAAGLKLVAVKNFPLAFGSLDGFRVWIAERKAVSEEAT